MANWGAVKHEQGLGTVGTFELPVGEQIEIIPAGWRNMFGTYANLVLVNTPNGLEPAAGCIKKPLENTNTEVWCGDRLVVVIIGPGSNDGTFTVQPVTRGVQTRPIPNTSTPAP